MALYWDFGDGNFSTAQLPAHPYVSSGTYTVKLATINEYGCKSDTANATITVKPIPNVVFTVIPAVCANASPITITQATETTGIPGAVPTPWAYTGTGVSGNTFNPSAAGVGTFPIIATFTAANGCKDADTSSVTVVPLPTVAFTVSPVTCEKTNISFTDNSSPNSASIQSWSWNFSDPPTSSIQNPIHNFNTAGSYIVTLTVTNSNNCTASLPKTVVIHNRPFANFSMPASVCLPDGGATFTNASTVADDPNPSYAWIFGDPNDPTGSTAISPTHHYSSTGPFTIQLTVTSQYGCVKDTMHVLSTVHAQPLADFTALPAEVCLGDVITFTGSTPAATSWSWTFGDGGTATVNSIPYTYTQSGIFQAAYSYVDANGCRSQSAVKPVTIDAYPTVDAGPDQYVLQGNSISLKATATGTGLTYLWSPATYLDYDTLLNPACTPNANQFYTLKVTGAGGCSAQDAMTVYLLKEPQIPNAFSPNGDGINDRWEIGQLIYYAGCTVDVFDRNGQNVFNSVGYANPWDGTFNGKPLPIGTYYYIINPKNGHKVISGSVTILR
jgi:gliding motility-associated-like protein